MHKSAKSTNFRAKCLSKIEKVKKLSGVPTNTVIYISRIHSLLRCQKVCFTYQKCTKIILREKKKRNMGTKIVKGQKEEELKGARISYLHISILTDEKENLKS